MKLQFKIVLPGLLVCLLYGHLTVRAQDYTESVQKPVRESVAIRQETQRTKERWLAEKDKRIAAYEALEARRVQLLEVQEALRKQLDRQQARNRELADQLAKLDAMTREIEPFLEETYNRLTESLRHDPALLPEERRLRLDRLQTLLQDPTIDIGEKYRKTMEAFFIEAEYGNTVDVYQQTIPIANQPVTVTILRLGRLALFYQSMDAKTCGYFDRSTGSWQTLPGSHNKGIQTAIEIARKQRPAQMVSLPIGRMVAK